MPPDETSPTLTDETQAAPSTANKENPSPATSDTGPTLGDVAREAYEKSQARSDAEEARSVPELDATEKKGDDAPVVEEEHTTDDKAPTTEEGSVDAPPFDKHPAWIKRTKEFNEQKAKLAEVEAQQKAVEPQLQQWQYHQKFLKQFGIPETEVAQMMNFLALMRQDPAKARESLRPVWESLHSVDPNTLPADLQKSVSDGELTEAHARRLWAAECKAKSGEVTGRFTAQQIAQRHADARSEAVTAWDMSKRKSDPDFRPKAPNAKDGLWEWTAKAYSFKKLNSDVNANDTELLESAYTEAKDILASQRPPPPNGRPLTSSRSSGTSRDAPKTLDEVVATVARKHGIEWSGRHHDEE